MIIKTLSLKENDKQRIVDFSPSHNLIHSEHNSRGKTTLLRLILYSLGYSIPSTKHIRFRDCNVVAIVTTDTIGDIELSRDALDSIHMKLNDKETTYILPDQLYELHQIIFNTNNINILNNILGAFYVDQEKGWTLLNRGKVIGNNHFNIEELIRGLSKKEIPDLLNKKKKLQRELSKYNLMFSIAEYKTKVEEQSGSLIVETPEERIDIAYEQLLIQKNMLQKELKRLDVAIKDHREFNKFLSEIKLLVQVNDEQVLITSDNIVGFNDNSEFLKAKRIVTAAKIHKLNTQISNIEIQKTKDSEQRSLFKDEKLFKSFDRRILSLSLDPIRISKERNRLSQKLTEVNKEISETTCVDNIVVKSLYSNFLKYARELNIHDDKLTSSYLFTSNLKELSGALLHKTAFAFRLAYIREIESVIGIKLPIILDSPSGKEVEKSTVQKMIDILKRDFSENQIIIASIFDYDLDTPNRIELNTRLIDQNCQKLLFSNESQQTQT